MSKAIIGIVLVLFVAGMGRGHAAQRKEMDKDVVYDEAKVPAYELPPLLVTAEGDRVITPEQWRTIRRPQILSLFSNLVYGRVPESPSPLKIEFEVVKTDPDFMKGKATRKDVVIRIQNGLGKKEMLVLVFVPTKKGRPTKLKTTVRVFLKYMVLLHGQLPTAPCSSSSYQPSI